MIKAITPEIEEYLNRRLTHFTGASEANWGHIRGMNNFQLESLFVDFAHEIQEAQIRKCTDMAIEYEGNTMEDIQRHVERIIK